MSVKVKDKAPLVFVGNKSWHLMPPKLSFSIQIGNSESVEDQVNILTDYLNQVCVRGDSSQEDVTPEFLADNLDQAQFLDLLAEIRACKGNSLSVKNSNLAE